MRETIVKNEKGAAIAVQYKDFWAYAARKKETIDSIRKMKADKREEFFLRWKHGMTEHSTNCDFEVAIKQSLKQFEGMPLDELDPYFRRSIELKRKFEEYCNLIKSQIGLWVRASDMPKELQEAAAAIGGTVVNVGQWKGSS